MNEIPKLTKVIEEGNELEIMKALQMKLAVTIDETRSARDIAALSKQLREVTEKVKELDELPKEDTILSIVQRNHAKRMRLYNGDLYGPQDGLSEQSEAAET